jgi:DNA-binding NarL/FixJ family response regulator
MVFADQVPPQLEHWLRKRSMRLQMNEASAIRPDDIRASGARYVILDAEALPAGQDPVELVRNLRQSIPELRITVSTARGDDAHVRNLTEAGAQGVVVKQPYVADLVFALQAEAEGRSFVSGRATERERAAVQITAREREVLELMANGHSNQAIGERLSISVKTVEAHRARLFKKLGASNVADAVLLAIRTGLVMP